MRFLSLWHPDPASLTGAPSAETMAKMGALIEKMTKDGTLVATGGLAPAGTRVKRAGEKVTVSEGPSKPIGGFAIFEVRSREHVLELTRTFLALAGNGECELHALMD